MCIADVGSMAINTDCPELVYLETVRRHVAQLTRLIEDPAYNDAEQLREFEAHWELLCQKEHGGLNELFVAWDGHGAESLQVKPARVDSGTDLRKTPIALTGALANDRQLASVRGIADWKSRPAVGKGLGVRVSDLEPAPASRDELSPWYFRAVERVDTAGGREFRRLRKKSSCDYWLVFSASIPDGETMFGVRWQSNLEGPLPSSEAAAKAGRWTATPYRVRSLSRSALVPRGGGSIDLNRRSVLLVGCGSVGSELALRLTSAGVGRLTVSDPDKFSEENLYRHVLSVPDIGRFKTDAIASEVALRHPVGRSDILAQAAGRIAGAGGAAEIRLGGDRDRFADGRTGICRILSPSSLGRPGDQLLVGRLRNRGSCDLGDAGNERMLALRLRGFREARARPHVKPELPAAGAGSDAEPRGLRHAVPALQRDRGGLHGDDGRGLGRAFSRGRGGNVVKGELDGIRRGSETGILRGYVAISAFRRAVADPAAVRRELRPLQRVTACHAFGDTDGGYM